MSRIVSLAVLMSAVAVAAPSPVRAQATREELQARIEALTEMVEEARRAEAEAMGRHRHDTLQVGPLIAIARPDWREHAIESLNQAWSTLQERFGVDAAFIEERFYAFGVPGEAWPPGQTFLDVGSADDILRDVDRSLRARLDPSESFLDQFPVSEMDERLRSVVYVQLATAQSKAVRSCYESDNTACRDALDLTELSDPVSVWYSTEEQRRLVEQWVEYSWVSQSVAVPRAVCHTGSDDACLEALRAVDPRALRPFDETARRLLVEVALRVGGDGALGRMLATGTRSVEDRLVAAAGVDADSLVAVWRAEVLASATSLASRSPRVSPLVAVTSLVWLLVMVFLSTRSTRWRSG